MGWGQGALHEAEVARACRAGGRYNGRTAARRATQRFPSVQAAAGRPNHNGVGTPSHLVNQPIAALLARS